MDVIHHLFDDNIEFVDIELCVNESSLFESIWNLFLQCIVQLIGSNNSFVLSRVTSDVMQKVIKAFRKLHIEIQVVEQDEQFEKVNGMVFSELNDHVKLVPSLNKKIRFVFFYGGMDTCRVACTRIA